MTQDVDDSGDERESKTTRVGRLLLLLREECTLDQLQGLLGVARSQLWRDICALRKAGWPIEESVNRGRTPKHLWIKGLEALRVRGEKSDGEKTKEKPQEPEADRQPDFLDWCLATPWSGGMM